MSPPQSESDSEPESAMSPVPELDSELSLLVLEPSVSEPSVLEPSVSEPSVLEPSVSEPSVSEPSPPELEKQLSPVPVS